MNRIPDIDPNHFEIPLMFGLYYLGKAMYDEALEEFKKHYVHDSLSTIYWNQFICAVKGDIDKAGEGFERIEERLDLERESIPFIWMAQFWAVLDEREKVFFYLDKANGQHDFLCFL